ncbi:MAG: hypothetical protein J2P15_12470, partial [Micromonosporaceae bacterium]|nr:hypothetical protein [Micromonosporaceae bacterium]
EVQAAAVELAARYQAANDMLPGMELRRTAGDSLSIAMAPFGWAIVHTSVDFDQRCTRGNATADHGSVDVRWQEPDSVPHDWFVPEQQAVSAVAGWIADGSLTDELTWSDQCL